jgi:ABC-type dipeptide/oligopeptide/nickel transport system permease component
MAQRIVSCFLTLLLVSFVSFLAVELAPGDPTRLLLGSTAQEIAPEALARIRSSQGFDAPFLERYLGWLKNLLSGNLGMSLKTNRPILSEFAARLPVTGLIALGTLVLACILGFALGVLCVLYEGRFVDHALRIAASLFHSVPAFLIGLFALYLFSFKLALLPLYGISGGGGLILPVLTLGGIMGLALARVLRNALLEIVHEEHFLAALGKGLGYPQAVLRHGLRNILPLMVTYLGMRFAGLLGGLVLIESMFSLPGMGSYILEAISSRDLPVIQAYILFIGSVVQACNLSADLLVRRLDPRVAKESVS